MDEMAKHLARCLFSRLDDIERESGMESWPQIADEEIRNEAMAIRENIRRLKGKLGQI